MSIAARWEMLNDLYAPMGDDGERHPEAGIISREQLLELLDHTSDSTLPPGTGPEPR